jgi:hypothetical protein
MADEFHGTIGTKARRGELPNITEIARQVSAMIGEEFFDSLAKNLSQVLHADCIYLGHFVGGQVERVGTLAAYLDNVAC